MARDIYKEVTDRIVSQLEQGAAPWVKPWKAMGGGNHTPMNMVTKRPYSGGNIIMLWMEAEMRGWTNLRFCTFKQALEVGANVRKGEHGTLVYFVNTMTKEDDKTGEDKRIAFLKAYTVFNIAQLENVPEGFAGATAIPQNDDERDAVIDEFIAHTQADIREGAGEAYFVPSKDFISIPAHKAFKSGDHYYSTLFHELGHWTGHKSRLDRLTKGFFGSPEYAQEELVAELTSAFLCAEFGVDGDLRHAGYLDHWLAALKKDSKAFVKAAAAAQKAADYCRRMALADNAKEIAA